MTTVLEAARQVVAASPVSFYRYDPAIGAYNSFCQEFVGLMWEKAKGRRTPNSYPSAAAARRDSVRSTTDWRQASPGDIIYLGSNHVGIYEGNGVMISATARSTRALEHLGKSVYRHRVDDYAAMLPPLFISHTNGKRERITEFTGAGPAGGGTTPFDSRKDEKMIHFYTNDGPAGSNGLRYHILHSGGVYTYTSGGSAFPNAVAAIIGSAIQCDAAFIEAMKRQYADQNPGGVTNVTGATVDTSALIAAIEKLGVKMDAVLAATKALNPPG